MKSQIRWLLLALILIPSPGFSFPEMIRKGYATCTACHVSPSGGGILTDYGREISKEVLATWAKKKGRKEQNFAHGFIRLDKKLAENLKFGGDIRAVQTYQDNPAVREGKWFLMQADFEAAWVSERFTVDATVGYDPGKPGDSDDNEFISRRHYALFQATDSILLRAGKYLFNYGLMIPDHTSVIRQGLGLNQGTETYNAELNYYSETLWISLTQSMGRPDDDEKPVLEGTILNASYFLDPSYRFGLSIFRGKDIAENDLEYIGPYMAIGIAKKAYLMGEYDLLRQRPAGGGEVNEGIQTFNKLGVEVYRGIDLYMVHETKKNDRKQSKLDNLNYGPGFQWSPRPHFIFTGQWQKRVSPSQASPRTTDYAYFVAQYTI